MPDTLGYRKGIVIPAPGWHRAATVAVAAEPERWCGEPVLAVNTVCYLDPIRRCGIEERGLGRLLEAHEWAGSADHLSRRQPEFASTIDEGAPGKQPR